MTDDQSEPWTSAEHLDEAFAAYIQAAETGRPLDKEEFLSKYPELAEDVRANERFDRMTAPMRVIEAGMVFGDYELLEEIGRGGMGVVFRARQVTLNRAIALKMILFGQLAAEEDVKRFHAEAEAAANLQHKNIITIHEVGQHEGQHYFSMDYVEGRSLAEVVRENPLPARKAAEYVRTIAEAIHYAHEQGTLHRDLKPANCLIDPSGRLRITDFGLAKRIEDDSKLTVSHAILGTPSYMPPEQVNGQHDKIGRASDVYSLGATLYELLTGRPPFRAETPLETLNQVINIEPVSPRSLNHNVPRDLETICLKCLAKEPGQRYRTAQELADELGRFQRREPICAKPIGRASRLWRWCRRNPLGAGLTATAALLLIAVTTMMILMVAARKARLAKEESDLRAVVEKTSLVIASRFSHYEKSLAELRGSAVVVLTRGKPNEDATVLHSDKNKPPNYHEPTIFRAAGATADQKTLQKLMQRLMLLRDPFKRTMVRSRKRKAGLPPPTDDEIRELLTNPTGAPLTWVYVALKERLDCTYPGNGDFPVKYDPRDRPWYKAAESLHLPDSVIWVGPYEDALGKGRMLSCSGPIYDYENNFLGVVCFDALEDLVISDILKVAEEHRVEAYLVLKTTEQIHVDAFLVDGRRKALVRVKPEKLPMKVVERIKEGKSGHVRTDHKLAAYFPLHVSSFAPAEPPCPTPLLHHKCYYVVVVDSDHIREVLDSMREYQNDSD